MDRTPGQSAAPQLRLGKLQDLGGRVLEAIHRAQDYLFRIQHFDGYWCGELEADSTLESDYIMVHHLLGTGNEDKLRKAAVTVLGSQLTDGGWPIYEGGPSNVSATVKAYFALKLQGYAADHSALVKARDCITALGGVTEINTYTKLYLCFFGQYDYRAVPAIPPEMVLFPTWFWFNLYEISSWSRAILVPLAIAYAKKPFRKIKPEQGIQELFPGGDMLKCNLHLKWAPELISWRNFFLVVNKF